jgi:hypothetical protein
VMTSPIVFDAASLSASTIARSLATAGWAVS